MSPLLLSHLTTSSAVFVPKTENNVICFEGVQLFRTQSSSTCSTAVVWLFCFVSFYRLKTRAGVRGGSRRSVPSYIRLRRFYISAAYRRVCGFANSLGNKNTIQQNTKTSNPPHRTSSATRRSLCMGEHV